MRRVVVALAAIGSCLALFAVLTLHSGAGSQPTTSTAGLRPSGPAPALHGHEDGGVCAADLAVPLQVELSAPEMAVPGVRTEAICRVIPARTAERIELALRPSVGAALETPGGRVHPEVGAGQEATFEVAATLAGDAPRATVDLVATAWIDGQPYERGVTWNLAPSPPSTGRVVARPGKLAVRELPAGRVTR